MKNTFLSRVLTFALAVIAVLCLITPASAAGQTGTLTVAYPLDGTLYHIYRVGSLKNGGIVMDDAFSGVDTSDLAAAAGVMAEMIKLTGVCPELASAQVTDGRAEFANLAMAVYLVVGEPGLQDGVNYWPTPFLVSVPQTDEQQHFVWDVDVVGKREMDMTISVVKRWVGDAVSTRPTSIVVHLVLDGKDYGDPVVLNAACGWTYTWENLPPKNWYVREDSYPSYSTVIVKNGNTFTISNTYKRVPQTGQLWWPVTVLTVLGLSLLCVGTARRRRSGENA